MALVSIRSCLAAGIIKKYYGGDISNPYIQQLLIISYWLYKRAWWDVRNLCIRKMSNSTSSVAMSLADDRNSRNYHKWGGHGHVSTSVYDKSTSRSPKINISLSLTIVLISTDSAISNVSRVTGTVEATRSVSTGSMRITVTHTSCTLVNIYRVYRVVCIIHIHLTRLPLQREPSPVYPGLQAQ